MCPFSSSAKSTFENRFFPEENRKMLKRRKKGGKISVATITGAPPARS